MVLVDAEESWIQTAIDELVTKMMNIYNSEKLLYLILFKHIEKIGLTI